MPGLGPKTARRFWVELQVEGPAELAAAIEAGKLVGRAGFGPKKIEQIRNALAAATPGPARRMPTLEAWRLAEHLVARLKATAPVDAIEVAGSLRRRRESIGDLDLLVTSREPEKVFDAFTALPERTETRLRGPTKETIVVTGGVQVDLRVLDPSSFGAALQYFTGSKDHNVQIRSLARDQGLKVNEYGVDRGSERVAGATEEEVYRSLGLPYIPPEIREAQGEIDAAKAGRVPRLVDLGDLLGDLHVHTASVDPNAIRALVAAAASRGWSYLGLVVPEGSVAAVRATTAALVGTGPTVWVGTEVDAGQLGRSVDADYRVVRAAGASPPESSTAPGAPPLLLAHLVSGDPGGLTDHEKAGPWTTWARAHELAVEVTPAGASNGLEATAARRFVDGGGTLHLGVGLDPADGGILAVGLARRAWVGPDRVLNATAPKELAARLRPTEKRARRSR